MCGIAGFISSRFSSQSAMSDTVVNMVNRLSHRGPDDQGIWMDFDSGIALAHKRLAVLDLSSTGHQPAVSDCKRYIMIFNGEIYNHLSIRKELEISKKNSVRSSEFSVVSKIHWKGHSDTETLLAAISEWGVSSAIKKCIGMFAIALWDRGKHELYIVRDRVGEKPLYYGMINNSFLFGSELKAFRGYPDFNNEINRESLALYLRHNYVPAPYSIYTGIFKLLPGTILKVSPGDIYKNTLQKPEEYWSLREVALYGQSNIFEGSESEATNELEYILKETIKDQMIADVPIGAFLSGGIDSSTITALMQGQAKTPINTFTIGFHEKGYNEAEYAHKVAKHLGSNHTELYVTSAKAIEVIPALPEFYDEPFADSSQIPTCLVSKLAKQYVTVSLSGDGGDELFGGYNRYIKGPLIWRSLHWLPRGLRLAMATILTTIPPELWGNIFLALNRLLPRSKQSSTPADKIHKIADLLAIRSPDEIYEALVSCWKNPSSVVKDTNGRLSIIEKFPSMDDIDLQHRMMYFDSISYLPDDILVKLDRAAMGVSLETRVPFLDHRLIEFAWKIPLSMKIQHGKGKKLIRNILQNYVPPELTERPKTGFAIPLGQWLRGPLNDWASQLLNKKRIETEEYLRSERIEKMWFEHLSGRKNWSFHLWSLLMFQQWLSKM